MKHTVTSEQVNSTAALAKLCLNEQEAQMMRRDLAALLEIADELACAGEEIGSSDDCPAMLLREDVTHGCMLREELLRNAPNHADGMIAVPGAIRGDV